VTRMIDGFRYVLMPPGRQWRTIVGTMVLDSIA
jgi:hypothetical protein